MRHAYCFLEAAVNMVRGFSGRLLLLAIIALVLHTGSCYTHFSVKVEDAKVRISASGKPSRTDSVGDFLSNIASLRGKMVALIP